MSEDLDGTPRAIHSMRKGDRLFVAGVVVTVLDAHDTGVVLMVEDDDE